MTFILIGGIKWCMDFYKKKEEAFKVSSGVLMCRGNKRLSGCVHLWSFVD
jgi:hypothetical protein